MTANDLLWCAVVLVEAAAAILAAVKVASIAGAPLVVRFRRSTHTPLVVLLCLAVVADLAIAVGKVLCLDGAPRPFTGTARAVYHIETALVMAWPCGLALAAWRTFADAQPRWYLAIAPSVAWGAWLGVFVALVVAHPMPRGWTAGVLLAHEIVAIAVAWWSISRGWGRAWRLAHLSLAVLVPAETVVVLLGPWLRNPFVTWHLARVTYLLAFSVIAGLHVHKLRSVAAESR